MATVHIMYVCLLMVVLVFHLMITPVTPAFLPRDPLTPTGLYRAFERSLPFDTGSARDILRQPGRYGRSSD